eukprot:10914379-Ditylum_brightwellii.AAC.1
MLSHPNLLEQGGNERFKSHLSSQHKSHYVAIPTCPTVLIVTINRVQSIYEAPLATTTTTTSSEEEEEEEEEEYTTQRLNDYFTR